MKIKRFFCMMMVISSVIFSSNNKKSLQEVAREDVDFVYATILENHPGIYNDQDPTFVANMNHFYQIALASIAQVHDQADHIKIINDFLQSFQDTHLRCFSNIGVKKHKKKQKKSSVFKLCNEGDIVWVTLPTFMPDKKQQLVLKKIIDQISSCKKASVIVFDVRGNSGGNSEWATKIVESLFTPEYAQFCMYQANKDVVVDWRVSQSNIDHLVSLLPLLSQQFDAHSCMLDEFQAVIEGMRQAQAQHQNLYEEKTKFQTFKNMHPINPVTAKIVVIMNASCVSTCLDFIDMLKAMDHDITLIGETTDADAVYMEVRVIDLASGMGRLQFPIKMYRNRLRGHNQPYVPDIPFPAACKRKKDLECWIRSTITEK